MFVTASVGVVGYTAAQFGTAQRAQFMNGTASALAVDVSDVSIVNVTDFAVGTGLVGGRPRRLMT
jgi:hypothetical protein